MGYAFPTYDKENMAIALGRALPISWKKSRELCAFLRGRELQECKDIMKRIIAKKQAVPVKRFTEGAGHKPGIGAGIYPVNAAKELLLLLEAVEANGQYKGLNTSQLILKHIGAQKAGKAWHYGRQRRRQMKRTNIEVVVAERRGEESEVRK